MKLSVRTFIRSVRILLITCACMTNSIMPLIVNLTYQDAAGNEQTFASLEEKTARTSVTLADALAAFPGHEEEINMPAQQLFTLISPKKFEKHFKPLMKLVADELAKEYNQNIPRPSPASINRVKEVLATKNIDTIADSIQVANYLEIPEIYQAGIELTAEKLIPDNPNKFCESIKHFNKIAISEDLLIEPMDKLIAAFMIEDSKRKNGCAKIIVSLLPHLFESWKSAHTLEVHTESINFVAFSPDGSHVLTGSADKTAKIWNAHTGNLEHILQVDLDEINSVSFSPDGNYILITRSNDNIARNYQHIILGNENNEISLDQALFIMLLYNLQQKKEHLDLTQDTDCIRLMRQILFSFNDDARNYLIKHYQILLPAHVERGESSDAAPETTEVKLTGEKREREASDEDELPPKKQKRNEPSERE